MATVRLGSIDWQIVLHSFLDIFFLNYDTENLKNSTTFKIMKTKELFFIWIICFLDIYISTMLSSIHRNIYHDMSCLLDIKINGQIIFNAKATDLYSIDVYTDNYLPPFFNLFLFRLLPNCFLLLGCVKILNTIVIFLKRLV